MGPRTALSTAGVWVKDGVCGAKIKSLAAKARKRDDRPLFLSQFSQSERSKIMYFRELELLIVRIPLC